MQRIIIGLLMMIGAVTLTTLGATGAFLSDTEASTGNTFASGSLDLRIDSQCHYFQNDIDVGCSTIAQGSTTPVSFGNWTETDLIPGIHKFFNFKDIKPGDRGESTISIHVYDNDAWGKFMVSSTSQSDNSCTEPEIKAEPNCANNLGQGELGQNMTAKIWLDQGSVPGFQNIGPTGLPTGYDSNPNVPGIQAYDTEEGDNIYQPNYEPLLASSTPLFGTSFNLWTLLATARANAATTSCLGQPVDGHVAGNGNPNNPYGPCNGLAVDGRLVGSTTYYIGWEWNLPFSVGNEIQTDSISGDVIFNVSQHRGNPGHTF